MLKNHASENYKALKAAKKSMRDVIVWYVAGCLCGLESREACDFMFQEIVYQARCDDHARDDLLNAWQNITGPKGLDMANKRESLIQMYQEMANADQRPNRVLQRLMGRARDDPTSGEPARGSKNEPSDDDAEHDHDAEHDQRMELQLDQISTRMQMEQMSEMLNTLMLDMKEVKDKLP
jgi:hypothetical protein